MSLSKFAAPALLALSALALSAGPTFVAQEAQVITSVESILSRDAVRSGETFKAAVILEIKNGYHINDSAPLDEFLYPTSLAFEDTAGLEILETAYPAGRRAKFDYSDFEVAVYEDQVVLGLLLRAEEDLAPGELTLRGTLSYQACNDSTCLPPAEIGFEIAVPVVPSSQKTIGTHPEVFEKIAFRKSPAK